MLQIYGGMILIFLIPIYLIKRYKDKHHDKGFSKVKDLVRGTLTADLAELKKAYKHFRKTPGI